ncbi:ParB/RepB/Spo0J family partition protein [Vibrio anguillarum]|jgi:ParB family transcriptional regulator, chromosome partitioning protein|uniref:Probable chromosome-partitioning protein ParB n=1 Tax=Vibrio anguillarum TaxID=55601 RepID=A0A1Q2BTW3_VIBAN|nr:MULTISPECIES: ParB/RepB/Spo0J family partition protein [Vibrio]NCO45724.1 ParB/RepB/Spo0J family partition protein [Vibrio sp.]AQM18378.1 chromosome partitioning protein ParB [Vibrio anguillarum]AQP34935.1 chromosome partitioning protein ParB [Vibrio anguillarum]ASG01129.1 chromosome partitioning protein ParB [Vibrio anguillarum]ASG04954.1 chromosome partitioning protein ParB [Vibrio anguillarum]
MTKRGLGKGLDALLATSSLAREKEQAASHSQALSSDGELMDIAVSNLKPGMYQPRKDMSAEALEELSASIQSQGIIQPIVVRRLELGGYEIIAGERRWRAAKQAGLKQVPCLIKNVQDRAAIAMALIENIQREDLNAIEEAQALERLQDEFKLTHQQVADVIGKSRTTVSNLLRLNQLADGVKRLVETKQLEMGHARALLMLEGDQQIEIAQRVAAKQLTVRQTEQLVKKCLTQPSEDGSASEDLDAQQMSQRLSEMLGAKVSIIRSKGGKAKMTISLDEPHKLEQLIAKLES